MQRHGLQAYWQAGSFSGAITVAIMYLESVNLDDGAGIWLGYCREVALDDDNNVLHTEDGNYLFVENEFTKANRDYGYERKVSGYGNHVDKETHEYLTYGTTHTCSSCNTYKNAWHLIRTEDGEYLCEHCKENVAKCSCCGKEIYNKDKLVEIREGVSVCSTCALEKTYTCSLCGNVELVDSDDIVEATRQRTKYHNLIHRQIGFVDVCPSCIEALKEKEVLRNRIVARFTRAEVTKEFAKVNNTIPLHSKVLPSSVKPMYIENCTPFVYRKNIKANNMYNVDFNNPSQVKSTYAMSMYRIKREEMERTDDKVYLKIIDGYLPIIKLEFKDRIEYRLSSFYNDNAVFILKDIFLKDFRDFSINKTTKEITYIDNSEEYYNDDKVFKVISYIPERKIQKSLLNEPNLMDIILDKEVLKEVLKDIKIEDEKVICPVCKEEIDISCEDNYRSTKDGTPVHIECARDVGVRCANCGKVVSLLDLGRNSIDNVSSDKENWCKDCIENYEMIPCSRCDTHIHRIDANYIDDEPYCDDCFIEINENDDDDDF